MAAVGGCISKSKFWNIYRLYDYYQMTIYMVLAATFASTGCILYSKLKQVSAYLAKVMKLRIILAVVFISGPIFIRGTLLISNAFLNWRNDLRTWSEKNHNVYYPIYYAMFYSILDLLPMGLQFLTVQMVINHKNAQVNKVIKLRATQSSKTEQNKRSTLLTNPDEAFESFTYTE
jgi:uncharacterized membrane-anchored protein YitT (DUF2179 family)